jgi:glycosyltransferase involved in cell wall biosynthesis
MLRGLHIAVVVPALNEERHITAVIQTMPAFVDRIWVVDDGSRDTTSERALRSGDHRVEVLRHDRTLGVGAALRTGYAAAFSAGADAVAVMAGDAQMDPSDLLPLLEPVVSGVADYSKGNRLSHSDVRRRMPVMRWLGNHVLSHLTRLVTGLSTMDSQCGFTALSKAGAEHLPMSELWHGYGYPNDLLGWIAIVGLRVVDVPVRPIYGEEVSGIRLRHALALIPALLLRVGLRRALHALRARDRTRELAQITGPG